MPPCWHVGLLDSSSVEMVCWVLEVPQGVFWALGRALNEDSRFVTCHLVETSDVGLPCSLEKLGMRRCCISKYYFFAKLCIISLQNYALFLCRHMQYFYCIIMRNISFAELCIYLHILTYICRFLAWNGEGLIFFIFFIDCVKLSLFEMMVSNCPLLY